MTFGILDDNHLKQVSGWVQPTLQGYPSMTGAGNGLAQRRREVQSYFHTQSQACSWVSLLAVVGVRLKRFIHLVRVEIRMFFLFRNPRTMAEWASPCHLVIFSPC